jgi:hypothetical protein
MTDRTAAMEEVAEHSEFKLRGRASESVDQRLRSIEDYLERINCRLFDESRRDGGKKEKKQKRGMVSTCVHFCWDITIFISVFIIICISTIVFFAAFRRYFHI